MAEGGKHINERSKGAHAQVRYYYSNKRVPMEEDMQHEFKGDKALSLDEVPKKRREICKGASRSICAFLNTGIGGTVYMGINDSGFVFGLPFTEYQKDHFLLNLENVLIQYSPYVLKHMYELRFVPVITEGAPVPMTDIYKTERYSLKSHDMRPTKLCWCEIECNACFRTGKPVPHYVVEIELFPWDSTDPRNKELNFTKMGLNPLYENEEGLCFMRRQASNQMCSVTDIVSMTRQQVWDYYAQLKKKPAA